VGFFRCSYRRPADGRGDDILQWCSAPAEGAFEVAAVNDQRPLGLVKLLFDCPLGRSEERRRFPTEAPPEDEEDGPRLRRPSGRTAASPAITLGCPGTDA